MKRLILYLSVGLLAIVVLAPAVEADDEWEKFGVESATVDVSDSQAGAHADFIASFELSAKEGKPYALSRDVVIELPAGLFGNPEAYPKCTTLQFGTGVQNSECPQDSQIGAIDASVVGLVDLTFSNSPIYNMPAPGGDVVARFGFYGGGYPNFINVRYKSETNTLEASVEGAPAAAVLVSSTVRFWGVPAAPIHDIERLTPAESIGGSGPPGGRPSTMPEVPFMSNPTSCEPERTATVTLTSYQQPNEPRSVTVPFPQMTGCGVVEFNPSTKVAMTSSQASDASGSVYELDFSTKGFEFPNLNVGSHLNRTEVLLPEGVTLNPSAANGQGVCTEADFGRETYDSPPNVGCPETSKLGLVAATTPLLDQEVRGSLYLAKPYENPVGSLVSFYMILKVPARGVMVKLVAEVTPDPLTGQLRVLVENVPQVPFAHFELRFRESANAPLITPSRCGSYEVISHFNPWSVPSKVESSTNSFQINSGAGRSACPPATGPLPFNPGYLAGAENNTAGSYSPFYMRLTRRDGNQDMTKLSIKLPPGVVGRLAGLIECSDAAIIQARSRTGRNGGHEELADPSCPASSQIGRALGGAGVGQVLTYAEGKVYLAGPYNSAPLSVVAILPAVAGPFDVGTVVTRMALRIDPKTAEVEVDGSSSDPIPHILAGIPLKVRDIRVYVDRPDFTLNSTSCNASEAGATLWGGGDDVFSVTDDSPHPLTSRYQAAECAALGFKPHLSLALRGGTKRGGHPALRAIYTPRKGDANLKDLVVRLPRSAFLDQAHIRTICTRVQFAANGGNGGGCPQASIYGYARAWTPLLDEPLEGPVYLRSSDHKLPDFVAAMHGMVDVEAVARIDSVRGGIRATFTNLPDAPLTKVRVDMQGAKKGVIVNSKNLCATRNRARTGFSGHNGRRSLTKPVVRPEKCGKKRKRHRGAS